MKNKVTGFLVLLICIFSVSDCASFYHAHMMRGSIVRIQKEVITICIGRRDGAQIGQILDVYVYDVDDGGSDSISGITSERTGKIKITKVHDDHYADAILMSGKAPMGAMAEISLKSR